MKKLLLTIMATAALLAVDNAPAQTNTPPPSIPQDFLNMAQQVVDGPWGVGGFVGRNFTGEGTTIAAEILTYDLVTNVQDTGFSSGLIVGYSQLWHAHAEQLNDVSGGWQFSETGHPLSFVGTTFVTNIIATVDLYQVVATPRGTGNVGSITGTSVSVNLTEWENFHLNVVGLYESRSGQTGFNGNYGLLGLSITHAF